MVRRSVLVLLTLLLLPLVAAADEQIPIKGKSDLKGNWGGGNFQGSFEPKPDGSAGYSTTGSTGTWRLFDVNSTRVLRFEGRNRGGQPNWSEITQEK